MKTHQVIDGEPYEISARHHVDICCDCGLAHISKYRITDIDGKPIKGARIFLKTWVSPGHTRTHRKKVKFHFGRV